MMLIALGILIPSLVAAVSFSMWTQLFSSQPGATKSAAGQLILDDTVSCVPTEPDRSSCVRYSHVAGSTVYGWPSKGGVYTLHDCLGVEMEFLGFDRFNPPTSRSGSQAEEDAHCDRS